MRLSINCSQNHFESQDVSESQASGEGCTLATLRVLVLNINTCRHIKSNGAFRKSGPGQHTNSWKDADC